MPPKQRSSFWKKALLIVVVSLALISVIGVMASGIFFFVIKKDWERTKCELLAKGEKLTLVELAPAPVPDAENFFGDPIWMELADLVPKGEENRIEPRIPVGQRQIDLLNPPLTEEQFAELKKKYPEVIWPSLLPSRVNVALGLRRNLPESATPEQRKNTAEAVLAVLTPTQPLVDKMSELVGRPYARFPMQYEKDYDMAYPHIIYLLKISQIIHSQAKANIVEGNSAEAFKDTKLLFQLTDTIKAEPALISSLVRVSILGMAMGCVADGIKAHVWQDDQLASFDRTLAGFDIIQDFIANLRGERGIFNQLAERLSVRTLLKNKGARVQSGGLPRFYQILLWSNQATYNQLIQEWIESLQKSPTSGFETRSPIEKRVEQLQASWKNRMFYYLILLSLPTIERAEGKMADTQDQVIQARIACALERYWLKNGHYPDDLTKLVPDYLAVVPKDIIDLQPMKYRHLTPDGFLLYSIGKDRIDDQGLPVKEGKGDWVWGEFKRINEH